MIRVFLVILLLMVLNISCSDDITIPEPVFGVSGLVIDTEGKPISDVRVYCLFNFDYIPSYPNLIKENFKYFTPGTFDFKLYQNFPNPVFNSTFLRFSLPYDAELRFNIKSLMTGDIVYSISGNYAYGLYQQYLNDLVSDFELENGEYLMTLKIKGSLGQELVTEKKLYVVSTLGKPNAKSNKSGFYLFDYKKAFIGDTIHITYQEDNPFPKVITSRIYLLFEKEGYASEIIRTDLIPNYLLKRDVILYKE